MTEEIAKVIGMILLAAIAGIGLGLLTAIPVWLLWNALMPELFGLKALTFWQALGLSVLCSCLFKSTSSSSSSKN